MAETVTGIDWSDNEKGAEQGKGLWEKWADGQVWKLDCIDDFKTPMTPDKVYANFRRWANRNGLSLRFQRVDDRTVMVCAEKGKREYPSKPVREPSTVKVVLASKMDGEVHPISRLAFGMNTTREQARSRITSYSSYHRMRIRLRVVDEDTLAFQFLGYKNDWK